MRGMNKKVVYKIAAWTVGMGFVGWFLGLKGSDAYTRYGFLIDVAPFTLGGAALGFALGFLFSLPLGDSK